MGGTGHWQKDLENRDVQSIPSQRIANHSCTRDNTSEEEGHFQALNSPTWGTVLICTKEWLTSLGFSFFNLFACPFSPFLHFLLQRLTFYWAFLPFKNFQKNIMEMGNFCHGVATCSGRKFCSEFFTQISEYFRAYFRLHWADHSDHWKDLFPLQKLSVVDANCGQRWWRQKWNRDQGSPLADIGGTGVDGLRRLPIGRCLKHNI